MEDFFGDLLEFILLALPPPKIKHKKKWVQKTVNFIIAVFWYIGIFVVFTALVMLVAGLVIFLIKWIFNLLIQWYINSGS